MDDRGMMHPTGTMNNGGAGMTMNQGYNMGQTGHDEPNEQRKQEIGDILQQIMTITDQSLDEAQARSW